MWYRHVGCPVSSLTFKHRMAFVWVCQPWGQTGQMFAMMCLFYFDLTWYIVRGTALDVARSGVWKIRSVRKK